MRRQYLFPLLASTLILTGCSPNASDSDQAGMEYYKLGNYKEAAEAFDAAIFKDNSQASYYIHLAFAYIELGEFDQALSKIDSALALDPNSQEAYRCQGIIYIALNNYEAAIHSLNTAISYADGFVGDMEYDLLDYRALAECKNGQYTAAIDTYSILLNVEYKTGQHYYLRGAAYLLNGDSARAFEDFDLALAATDADYDRYLNVYTALSQSGYADEAAAYLQNALLLDIGKQEDAFSKGKIYYFLGDYANAMTSLSTARDKGNTEALLYLGKIYISQGDFDTASVTLEQYVESGSVSGEVYNQLGIIRFERGDYEAALNYFETGLSCTDLSARKALLYNEAVTYEYLLDFDTAALKMAAYVAAYPDDTAARRENDFLKTR